MLGFPRYGDAISVSRSLSGFCMKRVVFSQNTPDRYSRYPLIDTPLKGIENTIKGIILVALTILSSVEAFIRLSIGLSALPLCFLAILPCFGEKLFSGVLSFTVDRIADFVGNFTMVSLARYYK